MIKKFEKKKIILFVLIFFILHVFAINLPPVNFEEIFAFAGNYSSLTNKANLDIYIHHQANTLGFSYLIYLTKFLLPWLSNLQIGKLISCFGILFIASGIINLSKIYKFENIGQILLITLLHPFIWTLSFRSTPDFISFALGFFSIYFLIEGKISIKYFLSIFLISISIIIKPHSSFFLIFLFAHIVIKFKEIENKDLIKHGIKIFLIIFLVSLFFFYNFYKFEFFLVNENFSDRHSLSIKNFFNNFILYSGYISLITFPYIMYINLQYFKFRIIKKSIIYLLLNIITFLFGIFFISYSSEMNFGFLSNNIPNNLITGTLTLLAFNLIVSIFVIYFKLNENIKSFFWIIIFSLIIFLIMLSLSRPAQRYLIYFIPLIFLILLQCVNVRILYNLNIIIFILLNILIFLNQYSTAYSAKKVLDYINKNDIDKFSIQYDRHLRPQIPILYYKSKNINFKKNFRVSQNKTGKIVDKTCAGISIFKKCNYIIKLN
tara:strand:+ start:762 stop:2231 length:1470 start_codon:yes stop_codon:yes gene_type:complete